MQVKWTKYLLLLFGMSFQEFEKIVGRPFALWERAIVASRWFFCHEEMYLRTAINGCQKMFFPNNGPDFRRNSVEVGEDQIGWVYRIGFRRAERREMACRRYHDRRTGEVLHTMDGVRFWMVHYSRRNGLQTSENDRKREVEE